MKAIRVTFTIRPYVWVRNAVIGTVSLIALMVPQHTSVAADLHSPLLISPSGLYRAEHIRIIRDELNTRAPDMTYFEARDVATTIVEESMSVGYDPLFVLAIIEAESNFVVEAVSKSGARGLMQIIPSTFRTVSSASRMFDPVENVRAGIRYLGKLSNFKKIESVLLAYNQGPGAAIEVHRGGEAPSEAQTYVPRVIGKYKSILERNGRNPKLANKSFRVSPKQYASILSSFDEGADRRAESIIPNGRTLASNP